MYPGCAQAANALLQETGAHLASSPAQSGPGGASSCQTDNPIPLDSLQMRDEPQAPVWAGRLGKKGRRRGRKVGGFFPATVLEGSDSVTGSTLHASSQEQTIAAGASVRNEQMVPKTVPQIGVPAGMLSSYQCTVHDGVAHVPATESHRLLYACRMGTLPCLLYHMRRCDLQVNQ